MMATQSNRKRPNRETKQIKSPEELLLESPVLKNGTITVRHQQEALSNEDFLKTLGQAAVVTAVTVTVAIGVCMLADALFGRKESEA
jgi:multisubunit Na+/H+ antiporter MnhC subunit